MADIELVIKIPEESYKHIYSDAEIMIYGGMRSMRSMRSYKTLFATLLRAIRKGTPLPKGHGRLIDADELRSEMDKDVRRAVSFVDLKDFVWLAPTIVKAERK